MAIRATGIKINDKALKKNVDNEVEKYVRRYESAGKKAMQELRSKYTLDWFLNGVNKDILDCISYRNHIEQRNGLAILDFESYINISNYEQYAKYHYPSLYRWRNKYDADINPPEFMIDLQWNQGIYGLPEIWQHPNRLLGQHGDPPYINPHFKQITPMEIYVENGISRDWERTVNKHLKK